MCPVSHGHMDLLRYRLVRVKDLVKSKEKEGSDSDDGAGKKMLVLEVEGVLLQYTQKVGNTTTSNLSRRADHIGVCESIVHL